MVLPPALVFFSVSLKVISCPVLGILLPFLAPKTSTKTGCLVSNWKM
jgi:hypothetical protein